MMNSVLYLLALVPMPLFSPLARVRVFVCVCVYAPVCQETEIIGKLLVNLNLWVSVRVPISLPFLFHVITDPR